MWPRMSGAFFLWRCYRSQHRNHSKCNFVASFAAMLGFTSFPRTVESSSVLSCSLQATPPMSAKGILQPSQQPSQDG